MLDSSSPHGRLAWGDFCIGGGRQTAGDRQEEQDCGEQGHLHHCCSRSEAKSRRLDEGWVGRLRRDRGNRGDLCQDYLAKSEFSQAPKAVVYPITIDSMDEYNHANFDGMKRFGTLTFERKGADVVMTDN